jgi:hypothetical protein
MDVCSVEGLHVELDGGHETETLTSGHITLRGPLFRVEFGDRIRMLGPGGDFRWIPGSDEEAGEHFCEESNAILYYDETTPEGAVAISYLDPIEKGADGLPVTQDSRRVTRSWEEWADWDEDGLKLFCLVISRWTAEDKPWCQGLVLCHVTGQPTGLFHRVGFFRTMAWATTTAVLSNPEHTTTTL